MSKDTGGLAFPKQARFHAKDGTLAEPAQTGMTLRDYFAAQALANSVICTGRAEDYELTAWFGRHAAGITRAEIVAAQAHEHADAMIARRSKDAP